MSVTLLPAAPDPLDPNFDDLAYAYTVAQTAMVPEINLLASDLNEMLNLSLLGMTSTTTSSITIVAPGGAIAFTTQANKGYKVGMTLKIASTVNPVNYVKVRLTAYDIATGVSAGTIISNGGSGTFASWSVFFDVPDPTVLSVPTGEAVVAGKLLAIDDAGNSMNIDAVTTAVLQAVTATGFHACNLTGGNTAIFWTAGTTDYRMLVVNKSGGTVAAVGYIFTGANSGTIWSAELTNGNIVLCYKSAGGDPAFRVITAAGAPVVGETIIEAVAPQAHIKCCALNGGFAVTYNTATSNRYAVYTNAGGVAKVPTNGVATASLQYVAICKTAANGFVALAGTTSLTGFIYDGAGTQIATCALNIPMQGAGALAAKSGSIVGAGRLTGAFYGPSVHIASDTTNNTVNSPDSAGSAYLQPKFNDLTAATTYLGSADIAVLGDGNYIATYAVTGAAGSSEYPRYVIFNSDGQVIRSGICFREATYGGSPVYVIPKDNNGFSLIWLNRSRNIKFAQIKSGKVVGVSLGAVGSTHQYLVNGEVNLIGNSMLNVGGSKVNYTQTGSVVTI